MLIHHITDLHIPEDAADERFAHILPNVLRMLAFTAAQAPDLLVITGDLSMQDGSRTACSWLREQIPDTQKTLIIPGNHDAPEVIYDVFGTQCCDNPGFYFSREQDQFQLLFVNTQSDSLPDEHIDFLRGHGNTSAAILFIHHPPDLISSGFMALNQPLRNQAIVSNIIRESGISDVFCGHYHNAIDKQCDGFRLHLSPSPAFQINLESEHFQMEPLQPIVRVIELNAGKVDTQLVAVH